MQNHLTAEDVSLDYSTSNKVRRHEAPYLMQSMLPRDRLDPNYVSYIGEEMQLDNVQSKASFQTVDPTSVHPSDNLSSNYKQSTIEPASQLRLGGRSSLGLNRKMEMQ